MRLKLIGLTCVLVAGIAFWTFRGSVQAADAQKSNIFADALSKDWQNWSWGSDVKLDGGSPVHSGKAAIGITLKQPWAGAYLHANSPFDAAQVNTLEFWIHGGSSGGQKIRVMLVDGNDRMLESGMPLTLQANTWTKIELPFAKFGDPEQVSGIAWADLSGAAQAQFFVDDIGFAQVGPSRPVEALTLSLDAKLERRVISDEIYGINFASENLAKKLRLPIRRWGGNATTRYNYQVDATNRASDWFFESLPESNANPNPLPANSSVNQFIDQNKRTGTKSLVTLPMIGWVSKSRTPACGFSVAKYGAQKAVDSERPDCGNGLKPDGTMITGNDPRDTDKAIGPDFVGTWIEALVKRYGRADQGGVTHYALDNEPALWNSTHRDVHPQALTYDELLKRSVDYASAIKRADPSAKTLGPAEWGWSNYLYSAADVASGGSWWDTRPDRKQHGDLELTAWYLQQLQAQEKRSGMRLLDYLDLHYYPQAQNVALNEDIGGATQALRSRSTRSLWDPTYKDESWIDQPVGLIPRMHKWVKDYYPGTKLAIGEYNFGALTKINGATTQADVLGIFGREGLDLATLWNMPESKDGSLEPGAMAFLMYRNTDGQGNGFGSTGFKASSSDQSKLSVFAAERKDGTFTVMVVNKTDRARAFRCDLKNLNVTAQASVYRYAESNLKAISKLANQSVSASGFDSSVPAHSITMYVLPRNR